MLGAVLSTVVADAAYMGLHPVMAAPPPAASVGPYEAAVNDTILQGGASPVGRVSSAPSMAPATASARCGGVRQQCSLFEDARFEEAAELSLTS